MSGPPNTAPFLGAPFVGSMGVYEATVGTNLFAAMGDFAEVCRGGVGAGFTALFFPSLGSYLPWPGPYLQAVYHSAVWEPGRNRWLIFFLPAPYAAATHPADWPGQPIGWGVDPAGGVTPA